MSRAVRSLLVLMIGVGALAFAASKLVHSTAFATPKDFLEYWASARLNLRGENPYDPARLLAEQQLADPGRREAVMMWNPPPALALYAPLGLFPARWAALVWVAAATPRRHARVRSACGESMRPIGRAGSRSSSACPSWGRGGWSPTGRTPACSLLGLAGFLHFIRKDRPLAAGAFAALTALKPHLLAGFGVLLIADASHAARTRCVSLIGVGVIALCARVRAARGPACVGQFARRGPRPRPGCDPAPRLDAAGAELLAAHGDSRRTSSGSSSCRVAVACVALVAWRLRAGDRWDWCARAAGRRRGVGAHDALRRMDLRPARAARAGGLVRGSPCESAVPGCSRSSSGQVAITDHLVRDARRTARVLVGRSRGAALCLAGFRNRHPIS